jgi:small subunit ribosomal protein S17
MASTQKSNTKTKANNEEEKKIKKGITSDKKEKKQKDKKSKDKVKQKTKVTEKEPTEEEKPKVKKKQATASAIDKTQARRLVKPTKKVKKTRKFVRIAKVEIKPRDIGVEVVPPTESCNDPKCPFHGTLPVRGQIINGIVISSKTDKTAIIQREVKRFIPKYERYEKRTHNYAVHNPPCLNVQRGDLVKIMECRPLSKSKSFVVIERQ